MALDIRPYNSAPSQNQSAFSVRWSAPILFENGVKDIAEYGCGRLRNLPIFLRKFNHIDLVDLPQQVDRIKDLLKQSNRVRLMTADSFYESNSKYDAIYLISVLHTIPSKSDRNRILQKCASKLHKNGFLIIDVPQSETYYNRRKKTSRKYRDGWLMKHGSTFTFYKNFMADELDKPIKDADNFQLLKRVRYCKHLIRIWQRMG